MHIIKMHFICGSCKLHLVFPVSSVSLNLICMFVIFQVYLKYPEVSLILPINIGSVAVDPTRACPSRPVPPTPVPRSGSNPTPAPAPSPAASTTDSVPPSLPPHTNPKPKPRPRSSYVPPSAPAAELYPQLPNTTEYNMEIPKSPESGHQTAVSPNAFSYAPGLSFGQGQNSHNTSQNRERSRTLSASCSMIHPPNYRTSLYPHGISNTQFSSVPLIFNLVHTINSYSNRNI